MSHSGWRWDAFANSFVSAALDAVVCSRTLGEANAMAWISTPNDNFEPLFWVILSEADLSKHSVSTVVASLCPFHQICKNLFSFKVQHRNSNEKCSPGSTETRQETSSKRGLAALLSGHPFPRDASSWVLLECCLLLVFQVTQRKFVSCLQHCECYYWSVNLQIFKDWISIIHTTEGIHTVS